MSKFNPATPPKILIVDDEKEVCTALQGFLEEEGFKVSTAGDGYEAINQLDQFAPDCILMDIRMPKLNGIEALGMIKFRKPNIEVIMVSAMNKKDIAAKAQQQGAFGYITKPIDLDQVLKQIQKAIKLKENRAKQTETKINGMRSQDPLIRDSENFISHDHLKDDSTFRFLKTPITLLKNEIEGLEHSLNVSWLSSLIAKEMNLPQVRLCELAGLYHDIGKFCFPHHIQNDQDTKWNPKEKDLYQKFPIYGQKLVQSYPQLGCLGIIIRHQQEYVDGTGFPDQLTGDMIPAESKVLAAANAFDEILEKEGIRNLRIHLGESQDLLEQLYCLGNTQLEMTVVIALSVAMDKMKIKQVRKAKIDMKNLAPKMILADHLLTQEGRVLYSRDTVLNPMNIEIIKDFAEIEFLKFPITVYKSKI